MSTPESNARIYVGDLPAKIDEAFLRSLFSECGPIPPGNIVIKKHRVPPKCYAFISFTQHKHAKKAIDELNYTKLDGVPIRISWNDAETNRIRKSGIGNLYISGLDESIEVSQLHEAFSEFGDIISCKIPLKKINDDPIEYKSNGYGYVQFRHPADAEKAMTDLSDASINGKQIKIEVYNKPPKKKIEETFTNVVIKPLSATINTDDDLKDLMEEFGDVQSVEIVRVNENTTVGLCNFANYESAVRATLDLTEIDGKPVQCIRAMTEEERRMFLEKQTAAFRRMENEETKGRSFYVKNFGSDITEEQLREYFEQFGLVESCRIAFDAKTYESLCYGYVLYETKEDAEKCLQEVLNHKLGKDTLYLASFKTLSIFTKMQIALPTKMQPDHVFSPMEMMQQPIQTAKDKLKQILIDNNIAGSELKKKLTSISDEQAEILINSSPENIEKWVQLEINMN